MRRWTNRVGAVIAVTAASVTLSLTGSADTRGTLTTAQGNVAVAGKAAGVHSPVAEGEPIVTGPESSCSVLVERTSLVQFCGQASVLVGHDVKRNTTLLDVQRGATRAVIGKRAPDEPLEIRTPIAIAEIRGTVITVNVDPATGDSTFSLEEGEVRIKGREAGAHPVTLRAGEQVTFRAGKAPGKVSRFQMEELQQSTPCRGDAAYRQAAVQQDRQESQSIDQIAVQDIPQPPISSDPGLGPRIPNQPIIPPPGPTQPVCQPPGCGPGNTGHPTTNTNSTPVSFPSENSKF